MTSLRRRQLMCIAVVVVIAAVCHAEEPPKIDVQKFSGLFRAAQTLSSSLGSIAGITEARLNELVTAFEVELASVKASVSGSDEEQLVKHYGVALNGFVILQMEERVRRLQQESGLQPSKPNDLSAAGILEIEQNLKKANELYQKAQVAALIRPGLPAAPEQGTILRAERLELVDGTGTVRARLLMVDDVPQLVFLDGAGTVRTRLTVASDGRVSGLMFYDANGEKLNPSATGRSGAKQSTPNPR